MILTTQSEKVNNRMEGVTIDTPKEKLGTPGFLKKEVEEDEQRLGADLRADSEDGDDESVDEAGPSKPVRRNRNLRVKGQPPTRISTQTVINEQDNLSKINELSSAKSSDSESDEEEITVNRKNLTKRVKQKEKVETRPTSDSEEEQVTVEQKGKVETNKKTKVRPITPDRLSETNPLRDIELWETTTTFPKMKEEDETVIIKRKNAGVPKEEAKHGALMASEPLNDEALCDSEVESEETILAKDCRVKSNQSYYNSQKLLQNQQQMTISLLAQVPAFNGMGSTKFEDWIKHFERVIDTSEFEEALSEIKKEAEGWKMASEKNQKLLSDLLQKKVEKKQKKREEGFINAVSTNSNVQAMDDTKRDLEELKITAKNNQKLLSDMMHATS
ncbi:pre-mRNA-processing factor 40 homolog A-like [Daphnia pulicaria]|uniref:pre-mRNA-processing factor 40 homolog A-like n=1 Tax=Daphnia pulicaria TaxID=35523 RepID=UPI001EEBB055|nr:pre-mRNA-processing factor 40 homolog A-like [Daphnia pulicaria]